MAERRPIGRAAPDVRRVRWDDEGGGGACKAAAAAAAAEKEKEKATASPKVAAAASPVAGSPFGGATRREPPTAWALSAAPKENAWAKVGGASLLAGSITLPVGIAKRNRARSYRTELGASRPRPHFDWSGTLHF